MSLEKMSDEQLLAATHQWVKEERRVSLVVLQHLHAIDTRRLYLERGYPSLFEMCLREFAYSPAAAMRRIEAMRLIRELPSVAEKIESGKISLSVAAQAQTFFRHEKKDGKKRSLQAKSQMLASFENLSSREVERKLAEENPAVLPRESVRFVTPDQVALNLTIPTELLRKLDRLKGIWSHRKPGMSTSDLLGMMAEELLQRHDPARKPLPTSEGVPAPTKSGAVSAALKRAVWQRDQGKCAFVDPRTRRRCCSTHLLQLDHIQPVSMGGESSLVNLRILCAGHNRYRNEKCGPLTFEDERPGAARPANVMKSSFH